MPRGACVVEMLVYVKLCLECLIWRYTLCALLLVAQCLEMPSFKIQDLNRPND